MHFCYFVTDMHYLLYKIEISILLQQFYKRQFGLQDPRLGFLKHEILLKSAKGKNHIGI